MQLFQINEGRVTFKEVDGFIRSFVAFPLLNSKLIPPNSSIIGPIVSDIYPGVVNKVVAGDFQLTLGNNSMTNMLVNPQQELKITKTKEAQYRFSLDDHACFMVSRSILDKAFEMKKEAIMGFQHLDNELETAPFLALEFSPRFIENRWRTFMFQEEASISAEYWILVDKVFNKFGWEFGSRSRRPAVNETNALLNYGYAILLSKITSLVLAAGLDPFVGFLHTLRSGKPSLCLDLMEPFRSVIDQVVGFILANGLLKKSDFDVKKNGVVLGDRAKEVISGKILESMMTKHRYALQMRDLVLEVKDRIIQNEMDG